MLVLSRRQGEAVMIGTEIMVELVEVRKHGTCKVGITAPRDVRVLRRELVLPEWGKDDEDGDETKRRKKKKRKKKV